MSVVQPRQRPRFNFLTYANRSGSTIFAKRLAHYAPDLLVMPEFRSPGVLLAYGDEALRQMTAAALYEVLAMDTQLTESLKLEPSDVRTLARNNVGAGIRSLLDDIASLYATTVERSRHIVLLKGSLAVRYPEVIRTVFPDARAISIVRDGRAVANSMLRTPVLWHDSDQMGRSDVFYCANHWRQALDDATLLAASVPLLEIRFEDLLDNELALLRDVCSFLGVPFESGGGQRPSFQVSEREQKLHPLLTEDLAPDRELAWQSELKRWQGVALESRVAEKLEAYGYERHFTVGLRPRERLLAVSRAAAIHTLVTPVWAIKRLWALRHRRRYIFVAARTALRRLARR